MKSAIHVKWLISLFLILCVAHVQAVSPAELLVTPAMFVGELPPMLLTDSIPTALGELRYLVQPEIPALLYQMDDTDIQTIALPADVRPQFTYAQLTLVGDETQAELCLLDGTSNTLLLVDFVANDAQSVGECPASRLNSTASRSTVSPDFSVLVRVSEEWADILTCDESDYRQYPIRLERGTSHQVVGCVRMEGIAFHRWLDVHRLLIRSYHPVDGMPPLEEWWLLDTANGQFTSLGIQIDVRMRTDHGLWFAPDGQSVLRLHTLDNKDKNEVLFEPHRCRLSKFDLATLTNQLFDTETACLYTPDISFSEDNRNVYYVHYAQHGSDHPRAALHEIELETGNIIRFNVEGKILQLLSVAPEQARAALLVDDHPDTVDSGQLQQGITVAHEPRWMIYDLIADRIVYEKSVFSPAPLEGVDLRRGLKRGAFGLRWTVIGWEALFLADGNEPAAFFIQSEIRRTRTIPLDALLPFHEQYAVAWSPDGTRLLITAGNGEDVRASYIFNTVDETLTPITYTEEDSVLVQVAWDADNTLIISLQSEDSPVATRWRIQPDPKSWT